MLDANNLLSGTVNAAGQVTGQAITATAPSTNVLDLGVARDIGAGGAPDLMVNIEVTQAFNNLTSLQVSVQGSSDNATWNDIVMSGAMLLANLVAGARILRINFPAWGLNQTGKPPRYIRFNYTVVGTAPTTGLIVGYISGGNDQINPAYNYPNNFVTA